VYSRAYELCQEIGETPQLFPVLVGLSRFYYGRNSSQRTAGLGEQILRLAHSGQDPSLMLVAHMMLGGNLFFQGEFTRAQTHAEQGLTLYDPRQHRALIFLYGDDPQVLCLCWEALALWYLGYPDQSLERIYQALRIAEDLAHPFGLTFALFWTTFLHQCRGEVARVQEQTEALDISNTVGERMHQAELYRLYGELLLAQGVKRQKSDLPSTQHPAPRKPKRVSSKPSRLLRNNRRSHWNCAQS
jgi:predicted ATPase